MLSILIFNAIYYIVFDSYKKSNLSMQNFLIITHSKQITKIKM